MKNLKIAFKTISILLLLINGCFAQSTKYYRQLSVNGKGEYIGRYPVDSKTANKVNCFRIDTDKSGSINKIGYYKSGMLKICGIEQCPMEKIAQIVFPQKGFESFLDENGKIVPNSEGVYYCELIYDRNGREIGEKYLDKSLESMEDKRGVAITYVKNDSLGRNISIIGVNKNGDTINIADEIREIRPKYGKSDYPIEIAAYDKSGNLVANAAGTAITQMDYDVQDNIIRITYKNARRIISPDKESGCAIIEYEYDNNGYVIGKRFYDGSHHLVIQNQNADNYAIQRYEYDYPGNCIVKKYFDANDILREAESYDTNDSLTEFSYYGPDGKPCETEENGIHKVHIIYDSLGNEIERISYGKDGDIKDNINGLAIIRQEYNASGKPSRISCFNADNKLAINQKVGYAIVEFKYNGRNLREEAKFYDQNKQLINLPMDGSGSASAAVLKFVYDESGKLIKVIGFDKDGNQTFSKDK